MQQFREQVGDDGGGEPGGVGVDQEEKRLRGEQGAALRQQLPKVILEPPHLAGAAAAVGRRIHDDGVVGATALQLAAGELQAVVDDVADGGLGEAAQGGVFAAPFDHALGGIDVADGGAGLGRGDRGGTGVAEKVEDIHVPSGLTGGGDPRGKPIPIHRLLREEAGVLERRRVNLERQPKRLVPDPPELGQGAPELPLAAPLFAPVVEPIPTLPAGLGSGRITGGRADRSHCRGGASAMSRPDDLWIRAHQGVLAPPLLFHAVAAVENLVVAPAIGDDQGRALDGWGGHRWE